MPLAGQKLVAPDGGWGWLVVLGQSITSLSTRSIEPSFGLIFGDLLDELGVATTGASLIMSTLDAMVNFSGLFIGPLVKKFSYRVVSIMGAFISCFALILTAHANSLTHMLLTYSILGGLGFGLATASAFVAINSYFNKKRGQAIGLAMAGTSLGFMAMPQLISRLLEIYDFRDTVFILGGLALNAIVGASLVQPVEWHLKPDNSKPVIKKEPPQVTESQALAEENDTENDCNCPQLPEDVEKEMSRSLLRLNIPRKSSVASGRHGQNVTNSTAMQNKSGSIINSKDVSAVSNMTARQRKTSIVSTVSHLDLDVLGSTMHLHMFIDSDNEDETAPAKKSLRKSMELKNGNTVDENNVKPKKSRSYWAKFSRLMDLDLLKDLRYLNILFGISITYIAESNFKLILPFFMASLNYSKRETAVAMSVMAFADVCARVVVPPVLDHYEVSRRKTVMFGCVCVALARSVLAEQTEWIPLMIVIAIHGFFRGYCLINFPLVISEYISVDKFAAAYGLSMVSKGIFIVLFGSFAGFVRDITGSYSLCIHSQSLMIMMCVIAWAIESVICWRRSRIEVEATDLT